MRTLENMTEPELKELCQLSGQAVELAAESLDVERPHFVLLLFNDPAVAQYVANVERRNIVKALREAANRLDNKEDVQRSPGPSLDHILNTQLLIDLGNAIDDITNCATALSAGLRTTAGVVSSVPERIRCNADQIDVIDAELRKRGLVR